METDEEAARGEGDILREEREEGRRNTSDIINDFSVIISVFTDLESLVDHSPYYRVYSRFACSGTPVKNFAHCLAHSHAEKTFSIHLVFNV